jgi:choline dehydrogenase
MDDHPDIRIPGRWSALLGTEVDWLYQTEPQAHLNNRVVDWNRGKVLGGSSSINNMVYIRGHRWDYDRWAELGNEEWSYADVLPYFKKSENQERGASEYHGVGGPLNVADIPQVSPVTEVVDCFIQAGLELGLPLNDDFNGARQEGIGRYQFTRKDGERHSTADAWLKPAWTRKNLQVKTEAHVTRLLFAGPRAVGVEYIHDNQTKQALAEKEVILCGGAINSPQLLLCSGIGPADHLRQFDIPLVVDLPGVGQNLQDHPLTVMRYLTTKTPIMGALNAISRKVSDDLSSIDESEDRDRVFDPLGKKLAIKDRDQITMVDQDDIDWIDAAGDYMCIHVAGTTHIMRATLKYLLEHLDNDLFKQVHRSGAFG